MLENLEEKGKTKFNEAIQFLESNQVSKAYDLLIEGYNLVSCDCTVGDWLPENNISFILHKQLDTNHYKYLFASAFVFYHADHFNLAELTINRYISQRPKDEIGYYFKGKIMNAMEQYEEAAYYYQKSLELKITSRSLYRLGRVREEKLKQYGLNEIYESIILNPSSSCAHWRLCEYGIKHKLFKDSNFLFSKDQMDNDDDLPVKVGLTIEKAYEGEEYYKIDQYLALLKNIIEPKINFNYLKPHHLWSFSPHFFE